MISCLKRKNVFFNPNVEPEIYLNREQIKKWFKKIITYCLPLGIKVAALFYGEKSGGKTHFLKHIQWHLVRANEPLVAYIDLQKVVSEFDFYLKIIDALSQCGFIEDFINKISILKDSISINQLTNGVRFGWIAKQLGFDPEQIYFWIYGRSPPVKGCWMHSVKRDANISRAILSELLKAFFKMNNRRYPIFLIDHLECILGELTQNYMSETAKNEAAKHIRTIGEHSHVIVALDNENYVTYQQCFSEFKSSYYFEFRLSCLEKDSFDEFFSEFREYVVDMQKLSKIDLNASREEHVSASSYPLTEECICFVRKFGKIQAGTFLAALNHALIESEEKGSGGVITRKLLEEKVRELDPYCLVVCKNCGLKLSKLNVEILIQHRQPSKILNVRCPTCNSPNDELLPLVLDDLVVDTSALVNLCVSALFNYLPNLGRFRKVNIYIPKAVRGELAGWEKKMNKLYASRAALYELARINGLKRRGSVNIEENIGRDPKVHEKFLAKYADSIDRIIMETAKVLNATIITGDKLMAENSAAMGVFSLLFQKKVSPKRINHPNSIMLKGGYRS